MTRWTHLAYLPVLAAALLIPVSGATAANTQNGASKKAAADPYAACMAAARIHPDEALKQAHAMWKAGDKAASRHCVATAMLSMGRPAQAAKVLDDLAAAVKDAPADQRAELSAQAGRAWLDAGHADKAAAAFTRALKAKPGDPQFLMARAVAWGAAGKDFKALDDLNRVIQHAPGNADAHVLRAAAYRREGAADLAQQDLDTALKLAPKLADAWLELGLLRKSRNNIAGARAALEKAAKLGGRSGTAEAARAALTKLGNRG